MLTSDDCNLGYHWASADLFTFKLEVVYSPVYWAVKKKSAQATGVGHFKGGHEYLLVAPMTTTAPRSATPSISDSRVATTDA